MIWADVIMKGMEQDSGEDGNISNQMIAAYEEKYAGIVKPIIELAQYIQGEVYYDNQVNYGSTFITGISPVYQQSYSIFMLEGRFITERDCQEKRGTIVISQETVRLYFGEEDATPYTYESKLLGTEINRALSHVEWQVELDENESIEGFAKETEEFFNRYFEDSDYYVMVSTTKESIESINQIIKILTMVVSVVYIISLIGCIIGIVGGIILGGVSAMMLPIILGDMLEKNNTGAVQLEVGLKIDYYVVGVSFLFSVLLGILFGYYPAKKATKKNLIKALRS